MKMVAGTAYIGDGRGGVLGNLQKEVEEHLNNQAWLDYKKGQGAENFQSYMAELRDTQEHALPYLQQYCSLEERGSTVIAEEQKSILNCYEGGRTKILREMRAGAAEIRSTGEDTAILEIPEEGDTAQNMHDM